MGAEDAHGPYTSFDAGAAAFFPSFYLPPVTAFTIEFWFRPACETTKDSADQSILRGVASPALLALGLAKGKMVLELGLNDPSSNNSYFADVFEVATERSVWGAGVWHQVAMAMNGTHVSMMVNGSAAGPAVMLAPSVKQLGPPCSDKRRTSDGRCVGTSGVLLGDGFNGDLKAVAVYAACLSEKRLKAHYDAMGEAGLWEDGGEQAEGSVVQWAWEEEEEEEEVVEEDDEGVDWYAAVSTSTQAASTETELGDGGMQAFAFAECKAGFKEAPEATPELRVWTGVACVIISLVPRRYTPSIPAYLSPVLTYSGTRCPVLR